MNSASAQCLSIYLTVLVAVFLYVAAIVSLRRRPIDEVSRAIWACVILLFPIIGALVFLWVRPGSMQRYPGR